MSDTIAEHSFEATIRSGDRAPRDEAFATSTSRRHAPATRSLATAAIPYGPRDDVDAALTYSVETLIRAGLRVGGLLQLFGAPIAPGKREMLLRILPGDGTIRLNDSRGSGVQGCILDTDALARAAMTFRGAVADSPDLLVAGRFGKEEAAGGGMRDELAEALIAGIPLLVPVRASLLPAWRAFLGQPADEIPPTSQAILSWAERNSPRRSSWNGFCAAAPMVW
jgi:hypothetical protein